MADLPRPIASPHDARSIGSDANGMLDVPGGTFRMGSDSFYPEEQPVREVEVNGFAIDRGPVTVEQFARFVDQTGYTLA